MNQEEKSGVNVNVNDKRTSVEAEADVESIDQERGGLASRSGSKSKSNASVVSKASLASVCLDVQDGQGMMEDCDLSRARSEDDGRYKNKRATRKIQ